METANCVSIRCNWFGQPTSLPIAGAGIIGTVVNIWVQRSYRNRRDTIRNLHQATEDEQN